MIEVKLTDCDGWQLIPGLKGEDGVNLSVFRILRAARPLRTINQIPSLRIIIKTFGKAGLPLANVVAIMFVALYMLCSKQTAAWICVLPLWMRYC